MQKKTTSVRVRTLATQTARNSFVFAAHALESARFGGVDVWSGASRECSMALQHATELRDTCESQREFERVLREDVGLDANETWVLAGELEGRQTVLRRGIGALAMVPQQQISTQKLRQSLNAYRESPECRRDLFSRASNPVKASKRSVAVGGSTKEGVGGKGDTLLLDSSSIFYPFIEYLRSAEAKDSRAEMLARISLCVDSGHAEKDLIGSLPSDAQERRSVQAFRTLFNRIRNNESVPAEELRTTVNALFQQRFVPIQVSSGEKKAGGRVYIAHEALGPGAQFVSDEGETRVMGSGFVDCVIRDAKDPSRWLAGVVTSLDDSTRQGDQAARHAQAIQDSMQKGVPPFQIGDTLSNVQFFSAAKVYTVPDGLQVARNFLGSIEGGVSFSERQAINAMTKFSMLNGVNNAINAPVEWILGLEHKTYGAQSPSQVSTPVSTQEANPSHVEPLVHQAANEIGIVLDLLAHRGAGLKNASADEALIVESVRAAANGLIRGCAQHEQALEPLLQRVKEVEILQSRYEAQGDLKTAQEWEALSDLLGDKKKRARLIKQKERVFTPEFMAAHEQDLNGLTDSFLGSLVGQRKMAAHIAQSLESGVLQADNKTHASTIEVMRSAARHGSERLVDAIIAGKISPFALWNNKVDGVSVRNLTLPQREQWLTQRLAKIERGVVNKSFAQATQAASEALRLKNAQPQDQTEAPRRRSRKSA